MNTQPQELSISEHAQKLGVLATQLGYQGALTVGALEDEIRFYQQRTVEACMELGKRLLILKEMTPHGEFEKRIDILGFSPRMARKFMSAVLKFSNRNSNSVLIASKTQTKLLELVVLDDDDLDVIEQGGSIGEVSLDSIETMSVRELKAALREAKKAVESKDQDLQAKDQVIQKKDQKANELDEKLTKLNSPVEIKRRTESEPQELEKAALETLGTESILFLTAFNRYTNALGGVMDIAESKDLPQLFECVDESLAATCQRFAHYVQRLGTQVSFEEILSPSWMFPEIADADTSGQ